MTKQDKPTEETRPKTLTMTEVMLMRELKKQQELNFLMAKALVKGRVDSRVLRYAEEVYASQKAIFETKEKPNE